MASEDVLVEIHPRELRFVFEMKKQSSCSIHLSNRSDQFVAFKVKTTSPKRYCVRPNAGVILPRASLYFTVTMRAEKNAPPDLQMKDKFLVQTTVVPFGTADEDIVPAFFSKETGRYIEENKLRVVLVSASHPQVEQLINGVPHAKATIEPQEEILDVMSGVYDVVNEVRPMKAGYPPSREEILDAMSGVYDVVNEVRPMKAGHPPSREEVPAILRPSSVKESPTVLRYFLVPSKEAPFTSTESVPSLKETPAVSVESHFSPTESSATLKESAPLEDTPVPRELAILSNKGPANAENLHLSHVTEDVQNLQSKLNNLEGKLGEAKTLIVKLRDEARITIQERDKLRKETVFLKSAGTAGSQAGFPMLFVLYMAFVGMSLGYLLHL